MPNRIVRDAILSSDSVASLKWDEEVFYRRLMSIVDDYGRHEASPKLIRSRCYPLQTDDVSLDDIRRWMLASSKAGLVLLYAVDGKEYLEVCKFGQQLRSASKCPDPLSSDSACNHLLADAHLGVSVSVGVSVSDIPVANATGEGSDGPLPAVVSEKVKPFKPPCPFEAIRDKYHECLPNHPRVEKLTDARKGMIRQRWLQDLPTLEAWGNYFADVAASRFLTGRADPRPGKPPFIADLEWLCRPSSFAKVSEGKYHR